MRKYQKHPGQDENEIDKNWLLFNASHYFQDPKADFSCVTIEMSDFDLKYNF